MENVLLALGTNVGDREQNIRTALEKLDKAFGRHYDALSPLLETEAIGFVAPPFINCIVRYRLGRTPLSILKICKGVEREMGRMDVPEYDDAGKRVYHDRIIDIDILFVGKRRISTDELTIPHPQVESRPYIKELLLNLQVK